MFFLVVSFVFHSFVYLFVPFCFICVSRSDVVSSAHATIPTIYNPIQYRKKFCFWNCDTAYFICAIGMRVCLSHYDVCDLGSLGLHCAHIDAIMRVFFDCYYNTCIQCLLFSLLLLFVCCLALFNTIFHSAIQSCTSNHGHSYIVFNYIIYV